MKSIQNNCQCQGDKIVLIFVLSIDGDITCPREYEDCFEHIYCISRARIVWKQKAVGQGT